MSTRREAQDARDQLKAAIDRAHKVQARCLEQIHDESLPKVEHRKAIVAHGKATSIIDELTPNLAEVEASLDAT